MEKERLPKIDIVGIGPGAEELLTVKARNIIEKSEVLIGTSRMIRGFSVPGAKVIDVANRLDQIVEQIEKHGDAGSITVLVSGDRGFYSLGQSLDEKLRGKYQVFHHPGISSLQYFCAQLGMGWHDVKVISLHGREHDLLGSVNCHKKVFVLTGGNTTPQAVCSLLKDNGLGGVTVNVGESLSYPEERILTNRADVLVKEQFGPLTVMMIVNGGLDKRAEWQDLRGGIPDEWFIRGESPMTKEEVRAISVSKLRLKEDHLVYDVGAGTGSVAIECALQVRKGMVYAIEREAERIGLIKKNKEKFGVTNLTPVLAEAPAGLEILPPPDRIFIGGSGGNLRAVLYTALEKNPELRIVINAITLETAYEAVKLLEELRMKDIEVIQMSVAKGRKAGHSHMMIGQNPVYIISAG